jgi:hypothetical protein
LRTRSEIETGRPRPVKAWLQTEISRRETAPAIGLKTELNKVYL